MIKIAAPTGEIFQSTLPVWGGTFGGGAVPGGTQDFNPPSPCGEGLSVDVFSTLDGSISIHPPRVGRDSKSSQKFFVNFCARR